MCCCVVQAVISLKQVQACIDTSGERDADCGCCLQIYVVGGLQTNMTSYAPFIETYDPVLDQWEIPMLPADIEPRAFAAMCTI